MIREDLSSRCSLQEILDHTLSDPSLKDTLLSVFCNTCLAASKIPEPAKNRSFRKTIAEFG
jgi:hypothetical protein